MTRKNIIIITIILILITSVVVSVIMFKNYKKSRFLEQLPFIESTDSITDRNNDGVSDTYQEYLGFDPSRSYTVEEYKSAFELKQVVGLDTDMDGITDEEELRVGMDPNVKNLWEDYLEAFKQKNQR